MIRLYTMEQPRSVSKKDIDAAKETIKNTGRFVHRNLETHRRAFSLQSFDDFAGKRVLDLGSGFGLPFARQLENVGVEANVISFSPAFADRATAPLTREERPADQHGKLMVAGMGEELPFADNSFDRVVSLSVVEHLETRERYLAFLREVVRVLVPEGIAYISPMIEEISGGHKIPAGNVMPKAELEQLLENTVDAHWNTFQQEDRRGVHTFYNLTLTKKT